MDWLRKTVAYLWNFRYLPMKYRWPLIKLRRRLFPSESPLRLRYSLRCARCLAYPPLRSSPLFTLGLLWPFPTWKLPASLPLPPRRIMADPKRVEQEGYDYRYLRLMPLWRARDTPERAFYRIYETLCTPDGVLTTQENEYFWRQASPDWATERIPDPRCEDPEQYAMMAALAELIVDSFNWRLQLGLRRNDPAFQNAYADPPPAAPEAYPAWTAAVPPLSEKLVVSECREDAESPFQRRNIFVSTGEFYTV